MNKTAIEWCDMTWNPVTGCLHNCEYCYARKMAIRFDKFDNPKPKTFLNISILEMEKYTKGHTVYHRAFQPSFHKDRLEEPRRIKKPQNIFVCSMADLFGEWVPDEWIQVVFEACEKAPQHRYLFLTKNPDRYLKLSVGGKLPTPRFGFWYGTTVEKVTSQRYLGMPAGYNRFLSIEPITEQINASYSIYSFNWVIVGAETGNRKGKVIPKREWIEGIVNACREAGTPVFLKDNLAEIWGESLIQEYPW